MASRKLDFVQVTYNALDREVEQRILPLAQERGIAVIINRPFREGALIRHVAAPPDPRMGRRYRRGVLGAGAAQVHRLPSRGHLRDSRDQPGGARGREPPRRPRRASRRGDATTHGGPHRVALMPEWWSYGLGDFLLFSPRTYYRLIERYNSGLWPLHLVALAAGDRPARSPAATHARPDPSRLRDPRDRVGLGRLGVPLSALRHHQLGCRVFRLWVRGRSGASGGRRRPPRLASVGRPARPCGPDRNSRARPGAGLPGDGTPGRPPLGQRRSASASFPIRPPSPPSDSFSTAVDRPAPHSW